jgi:hypothetical protein
MRKLLALLLALMLVGLQVPQVLSQEEATPSASPPSMTEFLDQIAQGQVCAWPVEVGVDTLNVGFPDTNSYYFILPYILSPGQSIIVEGTYPFVRFLSINTYYRDLSGLGSGLELVGWLPDYAIAPEAGSTNPAVDPNVSTDPAQRQWTVRVTGMASASTTPEVSTPVDGQNILAGMPEGIDAAIGVLGLRLYVPTDAGSPTGGVDLPALTLEDGSGGSRTLTPCTDAERETWKTFFTPFIAQIIQAAPPLPMPPSVDAQPEWVQNNFPGIGTNPDNRYLMVPVAWQPDRIVVIRGQAPTFPDTRAGEPSTTPADLRYWSFCTGSNAVPLVTASCVDDFEMPLDADGMYTIVVSHAEDQPANATVETGVAWLHAGDPAQPELVYLRHMLPSEEFYDQSVWAVPEGVVGAAEEIMGPYYPQVTYCDMATFEEGGADACFAQSE